MLSHWLQKRVHPQPNSKDIGAGTQKYVWPSAGQSLTAVTNVATTTKVMTTNQLTALFIFFSKTLLIGHHFDSDSENEVLEFASVEWEQEAVEHLKD